MSLNAQAEGFLRLSGCEPAFLGYRGFPAVLCVSINGEVIHGIPDGRKFEDRDVVKLDLGLMDADGQYDDGAVTVIVGRGSNVARRLVKSAREALDAGCAAAKAGSTTHDIGRAIEAVAKRDGFSVIEGYGGHGIGRELHMEPSVPNCVTGDPVVLVAGQRLAIEPMFSSKRGAVVVGKNGWTVKLAGGGIAAHFERTVTVL